MIPTPLHDSIIIRQDEPQETKGGFIIPETFRKRPLQGTVLSVGKGKWLDGVRAPPSLKPGDRIVFEPHSALDIRPLGPRIAILREGDVLGVLTSG